MLNLLGRLNLGVIALALPWVAPLKAPHYQSPSLEPLAVVRSGPANAVQITTVGEMLLTQEWFDLIFRGGVPQDNDRPKRTAATYGTVCVRLCDGFSFPISYSTSRERFAADAKQCEQRCPTRSRLFVHRNPGEGIADSVDLQGRPYRSLPTAFLHRTQYVADCTCRGNPWDEAALGRHRAYADTARKKAANKTADKSPLTQTERSPLGHDRWARRE